MPTATIHSKSVKNAATPFFDVGPIAVTPIPALAQKLTRPLCARGGRCIVNAWVELVVDLESCLDFRPSY